MSDVSERNGFDPFLNLPTGWRCLSDPTRDLLVLLHEGGAWTEVSARMIKPDVFPREAARAFVAGIASWAESGERGRFDVVMSRRPDSVWGFSYSAECRRSVVPAMAAT